MWPAVLEHDFAICAYNTVLLIIINGNVAFKFSGGKQSCGIFLPHLCSGEVWDFVVIQESW